MLQINNQGREYRPHFQPSKSIYETKNNSHMDVHFNSFMDNRTTPGSVLPVTPYEIWQMERFGNFIRESNPTPQEPGKTFFEYQIEIFENDEIHDK